MPTAQPLVAQPWREVEIALQAAQPYVNAYTAVEVWADFTHASGPTLRRPAFWDGGSTWKVRFASPLAEGRWTWRSFCSAADSGLAGQSGVIECEPGPAADHRFYRHGFWRMSPGGRNLVHADGRGAVLVGDTAWGLPWRATHAQCEVYARDRGAKGFNAVLLMSVQPDMDARGPRDRSADEGFAVGFEDLASGHINQLNPEYFQYLDGLIDILVAHEIVPVFQPVFFGFGWKGLRVAGPLLPLEEYARYCRYLVARYGRGRRFTWWAATAPAVSRRWRRAVKRLSGGTPIGSRRVSTTGRTSSPTRTRRPTGSTSSGARRAIRASISPSGWPTCGATNP